jgi:hypothetical protein
MFVQIVQGRVGDAAAARARFDTWMNEVQDGSIGWLGSTAGVTDDGTLVVLARFESEEAARQNADRPEQTAWWEETRQIFTGEPEFHNSSRVDFDLYGEPDHAGFVQVMQGRTTDPERARDIMNNDSIDWKGFRPEILGSMTVEHDDDAWTMALYFTSEEEAREGERKEPPPEMQKMMQELQTVSAGEPTYFDLRNPWLQSPS